VNKTRVWLTMGFCLVALAAVAHGQSRKAGLWEVTTQMSMSGGPTNMPQMPPRTNQVCVTQAMIDRYAACPGELPDDGRVADCDRHDREHGLHRTNDDDRHSTGYVCGCEHNQDHRANDDAHGPEHDEHDHAVDRELQRCGLRERAAVGDAGDEVDRKIQNSPEKCAAHRSVRTD
jgi:hypothetical protein